MPILRTVIAASLGAAMLAPAACAPKPIITGCELYPPAPGITFSAERDTPETVREIRRTNAAFRSACW